MDNLNTIDPYADLEATPLAAPPSIASTSTSTMPSANVPNQNDPYADLGGKIADEQEQAEVKYPDWKSKAQGAVTAIVEGLISRPVVAAAERALGITEEESRQKKMSLGKGVATGLEFGAMVAPAVMSLGSSALAKAGLLGAAETAAKVASLGEFTNAGMLSALGGKAAAKLGAEGAIKNLAISGGIENALFALEDEAAKAIKGSPDSVNQAVWNVGLSGILGAGIGGGLGKVGQMWKDKYGPAAREFAKDFQKTQKDIVSGNMPAADVVGPELQTVVDTADDFTKRLAGAEGLKRQEIEKILPKETTAKMIATSDDVLEKTNELLVKAKTDPLLSTGPQSKINGLEAAAVELAAQLSNPKMTPFERWSVLNKYKQNLDKLRIWEVGQTEAVNLVREARTATKLALEDASAWGAAGTRQKEINAAITDWKNKFKAAKSFVGNQIGGKYGDYVINPDKLQTIINQAKKGKGAIKQNALSEFLDSTDNLYKTVSEVNSRLGIDVDMTMPSLTATRAVTQKWTPGMKAAYALYNQAIDSASEAAGAATGYKIGKATVIPGAEWAGALFGHYAFKPIMKTIMPVIINPILNVGATGMGIRAASNTINAIVDGKTISKLAADALFLDKKPPTKAKSQNDLIKLDKQLQDAQRNPQNLLNMTEDLNELMPNHAVALSNVAANAMTYLNEKRPKPRILSPLDAQKEPSKIEMQDYYRTLEIADNPLVMLQKMKNGTLKSKDVIDFQAMYPTLYNDLQMKVIDSLALHKSQNKIIPYKLRKSLSLFAGQPLDVNTRPESIQAAQATYQPQQQPQSQLPQMAKKSSRISKLPSLTETDQQRRMLNK